MNRLFAALCAAAFAAASHAHEVTDAPKPPKWDQKTLDLFATLPIQDGGRVKPLDTFAGFTLLNLNANRDWQETADKDAPKFGHTEWLLNTLFFPETAMHYEVVFVENTEVLDAIGISHEGKKRYSRYSYEQLEPGFPKLFELAREYQPKDPKEQTAFERQTVALAMKMQMLDTLLHAMNWAQAEYPAAGSEGLKLIFGGAETARYSEVLANAKAIQHLVSGIEGGIAGMDAAFRESEQAALENLVRPFIVDASRPSTLNILPPAGALKDEPEWFAPTGPMPVEGEQPHSLMNFAFQRDVAMDEQIAMTAAFGELMRLRGDSLAFTTQLEKVHAMVTAAAESRGEYAAVPIEVAFYRGEYFWKALIYFAIAFVFSAFVLVKPGSKHWFWRAHWWVSIGLLLIPTGYLIYGIVLRCIIRQRPPITNLYETVLFIAATLVVTALVIEVINRRRIALPTGAFLGLIGMFLANRYEAKEAVDTMPSLVAVLDTNFWLATHVTIVNIGYAAGILAAAIAHIYIFGKLLGGVLGRPVGSKKFYADITRMVYGTICFGLCFATVGTVLGGIWANDSWGRFWGWDPKENGALMIVLWQLFMLHGRMGGYLRQYGLNIAAVFGGIIVAFSWWHVNHLGVGLHSYGFTDGIVGNLVKYYVFQIFVIVCGFAAFGLERLRIDDTAPAPAPKGKKKRGLPVPGDEVPAK